MRRLCVLSGDAEWSAQQARNIAAQCPGDWLWIGAQPQDDFRTLLPEKANQLLGQEFLHGIFDAREGLNVEALAAFSGVLRAGSWLILLVPEWNEWPSLPDADSRRWSEQPDAIATPRFIEHFCRHIMADSQAVLWRQGEDLRAPLLPHAPNWAMPLGAPTGQQQVILDQLLQAQDGVWVLTAARGRGKSTLAGMLVQQWQGRCWITAPSRASGQRLNEQGEEQAFFHAPDALLEFLENGGKVDADWLLIDEAAAIPAPLLSRLIGFFPRVLLTTTVQGYEGTGRGFLLKFCASLPKWHDLRLSAPIRWAENDPLEAFIDRALLFNELIIDFPPFLPALPLDIKHVNNDIWSQDPALLEAFYSLLSSAHYRTSPLDLRRLMDAPGMAFSVAMRGERLAAALWLVDEGGLSPALAHEVWAGRRRPRGNLVAQSLAAHGGFPSAAVLRSRRITRIATAAECRRQGIAKTLVQEQCQQAEREGLDYLSVSFGFTKDLWQFWQGCGFKMVRVGGQREASSGCFAAMAMLPLSDAGIQLCQDATLQLARNASQLPEEVATILFSDQSVIRDVVESDGKAFELDDADWRELVGFAFAHRAFDSSQSALQRLLIISALPLPALRASVQQQQPAAEIAARLRLSGKKALLQHYRQETREALQQLDAARANVWQAFAAPASGF